MTSPQRPGGGSLLGKGALPYVVPFGVFLVFLAARPLLPFAMEWVQALRFGIILLLLITLSRSAMGGRITDPVGSIALGVAVFCIWVGPDLLWPAYRQSWLFDNRLVGAAASSLPQRLRTNVIFLVFRVLASVVNVPALEELFWRGWLMRWLISTDFRKVPLGSYTARSFWVVAVLFATEHGPYWDVGLIAGILYNWWMVRTRSLSDCMVAHAVTNACLAWYVLARGHWEYWL
jgi:uncharacterized protein